MAGMVLGVLSLLATGPAGAAEDPAAPGAVAAPELVNGVEGAKAALVRIEVRATAEIAHINHDTGVVGIVRGRYDVPIRTATGVFVSAEGVIATAGRTLTVTEDDVVVHAANRLFQEQMGAVLVGNDGDPSRPAQAVDPRMDHHLQDCYGHVEHCVLFFVTHFTVFPHAQSPVSTPAELFRTPQHDGDVGLLRISGGGGTPTAELAPPEREVPEQGLLVGFLDPPAPEVPATEVVVGIDPAAGTLATEGDVGPPDMRLAGGPVLDPGNGQVVGLATPVDATLALLPVGPLHEALTAAGVQPTSSPFDALFRQGIDLMSSEGSSASAASSFEESLTHYDSALAAQHLVQAQAADDGAAAGEGGTGEEGGSAGGWLRWLVIAVVVVLLLLALVLVLRRRRSAARRAGPDAGEPVASQVPLAVTAAAPRPDPATGPSASVAHGRPTPEQARPSDDRTRLRQSPAMVKDPAPRPPATAFCSDCGARLRDGARFCASCGSPVA